MSYKDSDVVEIFPSHAFFNAGLVGLYDVLMTRARSMNDYDAIKVLESSTTSLRIPKKLLVGIDGAWVDAVIERYKPQSACAELLNSYGRMKIAAGKGEVSGEQADMLLTKTTKILSSQRYKSAMAVIRDGGDEYDPLPVIKPLAKDKNGAANSRILSAAPVFEYIERHKRLFMMKDAAYTVLNQYWTNVSFLNQQMNKVDMEKCFGDFFIRPLEKFVDSPSKGGYSCFECGEPALKKELLPMSWICDMGVDVERKKSNYWYFTPDTFICPVCALAYACMPLGFTVLGGQGMFINTNAGMEQLLAANNFRQDPMGLLANTGIDKEEAKSAASFERLRTRAYIATCDCIKAKKQLEGLQVVLRRRSGIKTAVYSTENLTRSQIRAIMGCERELMSLIKITVKIGEKQYLNLFDKAIENLIANRNQHSLIQTVAYSQLKENRPLFPMWFLLVVQIYQKGGENVENTKRMKKLADDIAHEGTNLHTAMSGDENEKSNKLRGYIYRLLNCVEAGNRKDFFDTVIRMYIGLERAFPTSLFMEMQSDDETFTVLAQSYIMGLSESTDKKDKKEEVKEEESNG